MLVASVLGLGMETCFLTTNSVHQNAGAQSILWPDIERLLTHIPDYIFQGAGTSYTG